MRLLRPLFRGPDGRLIATPSAAAGPSPRVDLAGPARLFAAPALFGEFAPSSFWVDVDVEWSPPRPSQAITGSLVEVFAGATEELCRETETVGVSLSGGLDSLAVLWQVTRLVPRRRVIAFAVDLVDDGGVRVGGVVRRLLADLDLARRVELKVIDPDRCRVRPIWSDLGPRLDALPMVNATVATLAENNGAEILLSGNGSDELLATPHYAAWDVYRRLGVRAAWRYAGDMARSAPGRTGEVAAIVTRFLSPSLRSRMYWATTWPDGAILVRPRCSRPTGTQRR